MGEFVMGVPVRLLDDKPADQNTKTAVGALWGPTEDEKHILQFFKFDHLPPHLAEVSMPFHELAHAIVECGEVLSPTGSTVAFNALPRNPERIVALRKLLEAKDAAVRAKLAAPNT